MLYPSRSYILLFVFDCRCLATCFCLSCQIFSSFSSSFLILSRSMQSPPPIHRSYHENLRDSISLLEGRGKESTGRCAEEKYRKQFLQLEIRLQVASISLIPMNVFQCLSYLNFQQHSTLLTHLVSWNTLFCWLPCHGILLISSYLFGCLPFLFPLQVHPFLSSY